MLRALEVPGATPVLVVTLVFVLAHTILYAYVASFPAHVGMAASVDAVLLAFGVASLLSIVIAAARPGPGPGEPRSGGLRSRPPRARIGGLRWSHEQDEGGWNTMIRALLAGLLLTGALAPAAAPAPATAPAAGSVVGVGAEPGSCAELAPAEPRAVVRLPVPTGPFPVGTRSFVVTDEAREDPFLPGSHRPRQLMVQAWYPARSTVGLRPARYVTPRTAAQLDAAYGLPGAYEGVRTNAFAGAPAAEERGGRR